MMSTTVETEIVAPIRGLRIVHLQHPDYGKPPPFVSWCGASVIGYPADCPVSCPDCVELQAERRRKRQARRQW